MASVEKMRVFIASPSEVKMEREMLEKVIKNINRQVEFTNARCNSVILIVALYETLKDKSVGN